MYFWTCHEFLAMILLLELCGLWTKRIARTYIRGMSCCLSVHMFQFENRRADFDQIWCERFATEGRPKLVRLNFLQLVTVKLPTHELAYWVQQWRHYWYAAASISNTNRGNDKHQSNCSNKFSSCTSSQLFGTCRNIKDTVADKKMRAHQYGPNLSDLISNFGTDLI
jgi:hypothetical protein